MYGGPGLTWSDPWKMGWLNWNLEAIVASAAAAAVVQRCRLISMQFSGSIPQPRTLFNYTLAVTRVLFPITTPDHPITELHGTALSWLAERRAIPTYCGPGRLSVRLSVSIFFARWVQNDWKWDQHTWHPWLMDGWSSGNPVWDIFWVRKVKVKVLLSVVVILLLVEMSCTFKWQFNDFVCGNVSLNNYEFLHNFYSHVGNDDWSPAHLLAESCEFLVTCICV